MKEKYIIEIKQIRDERLFSFQKVQEYQDLKDNLKGTKSR